MHNAVEFEYGIDVTEVLISCGADLDVVNEKDITPLNYAIDLENSRLIKLLVESGANCDLKNKNSDNAMEQSLKEGKINSAKVLLYLTH